HPAPHPALRGETAEERLPREPQDGRSKQWSAQADPPCEEVEPSISAGTVPSRGRERARGTSGSSVTCAANHLQPLGPRCPKQPGSCLGFLMVDPFVGLWGVPSLPECTASWPSRPYTQVRPVRLTAFPGVPIRFPDSATLAAWSEANSTGGQNRGQGFETAGQRQYVQVDRYGGRVTIGGLSPNTLVRPPARPIPRGPS